MKRLSISVPVIALALILILPGAAFTPKTAAATPATTAGSNTHFDLSYYWYTYPGDAFIDYETVAVEELEFLIEDGWLVNTDSRGGTLIARGYMTNAYPHSGFPSALLYRH